MTPDTQTDGVPTFVVEASGARRAMLAFRVGRADERLPTGGITHLVEHLALLPFREQPYQYGAHVEGARTVFWVQGSDAQIREFMRRLTENLAALPLDRLADEARLLETEARSRRTTALESLLGIRYGATGWGVLGFPEYGLARPDPDRVRAWAERWFTAENAALGLSGPVDGGLTLGLRAGTRMPPPAATTLASTRTPAWMHERHPGVGIGFIGPRSVRFGGLLRILERHARGRLRFGESLSYEVATNSLRLTAELAHGIVWADALPENMSKVWTGLLGVIDELMEAGPSDAELRDDIDALRQGMQDLAWPLSMLDRAVTNELFGTPTETGDGLVAELEETAPADYRALLQQVFPTVVAAVPHNVAVLDARFTPVPIWSTEEVEGHAYRLQAPKTPLQGRTTWLTVGGTGVTLHSGPGQWVTIPFAECEAVLAWDDGSVILLSRDSFRLHIRPADWTASEEIVQALDKQLPKELTVPMGPRPNPDPEALSGPAQGAPASTPKRSPGYWWTRVGIIAGLIIAYILATMVRSLIKGG